MPWNLQEQSLHLAGASSQPSGVAPETFGTFSPVDIVENSTGASWYAAHWGLSTLIHVCTIAFLLSLPLFSSETMRPYWRTQDMIVLPLAPRMFARSELRSKRPVPPSAIYPAVLAVPVFAPHPRQQGLANLLPPVDPLRVDSAGLANGLGDTLAGVLSENPSSGVLAIPAKDREVVHRGGDLENARLIDFPLHYPELAKMAGVFGKVVVSAMIDPTGKVIKVRVLSGPPLLISAAIDAVSRARFKPVFLDGEPTRCDLRVEVVFQLPERQSELN